MVSAPNFKEGLEENGNGRSDKDMEIMEVDGNSELSSSTTVSAELEENGGVSDLEEEDENRPQIFIRDFSEIAEKSDEDEEEDDIVIIDEVKGSSPTRALKGLVNMTLDDGSTLLELTVEDGGRDLASRFAAEKRLQHGELKVQLLKMKKAMIERSKLRQNVPPPPTTTWTPSQPLIRMTPSVSAAPIRFQTPGQSLAAAPRQVFSFRHPVPASRMGLSVRPRVIRPSGNGVGIRQPPPPPVQVRPATSLDATGVSLVTTDASNNVVTVPLSDYKIVHPTCTVQQPQSLIPAGYGVLPRNVQFSSQPQTPIRLGNTNLIRLPSGIQIRQVNQHQPRSPPPALPPSIVTIRPTQGRASPQPILPRNDHHLLRPRNSGPTPSPRPGPRGPSSAQENQEDNLIITAGTQRPLPGVQEGDGPPTNKKTYPSLVIHVKPCLHLKPTASALSKARRELDSKVKQQLLLPPAKFTEGLMRRGLLKIEHNCANHPRFPMKLGTYADTAKQPFSGGYVWTSDCCPQTQLSVFKGSFFEGSKFPPGTLLKLIYHWACQTPMDNVLLWVKVPSTLVKNIYGLLRAACILWLHEKCGLLGGEGKFVEIAMITLGATGTTPKGSRNNTVEILGVFDPLTRAVRLKVINVSFGKTKGDWKTDAEEGGARAFQILWALSHWVDKRSVLLVDEFIDKTLFYELGFLRVVQTSKGTPKKAEEPSNANITNYLRHYVPRLFASTMAVLTKNIIQEFLDELSWREQWGPNSLLTFENIINQLVEETKWEAGGMGLLQRLSKVKENPFLDWSITMQGQRSPLLTIPHTIRSKPGIQECIQHIMNKKMSPIVAPATATKRKVSQSPSLAPIQTPTRDPADYQRKVEYFKEAKKELNLDHYYYGRLPSKPSKSWSQSKFTLLKCPLCPTVFSLSNRDIVSHLGEHVSALLKISEGSLCNYCLKPPYTTLKEHLDEEHFFVGCPFVCWICRLKFESEQELTIHMWTLHVEAEAPYSCEVCEFTSSIHSEVIDHFGALHGDIGYVICPHCLKVLAAKSQANLGSIVAHLQSHHLKREKKCPKCVLSFGIDSELQLHLVKCHSSKRDEPAWEQKMISKQNPIFMAIPPVPLMISVQSLPLLPQIQPTVQKKRKWSESQSIPVVDSVAVPIDSLNAPLALPVDKNEKFGASMFPIKMSNISEGKALCFECGKDVTTPNHFVGRLSCNKCRFSTSCEAAMNLHHEKKHDGGGKSGNVNFNQAELMAKPLVCECGFSSENPYELAEHLVNCEKYTAFPVPTQDEDDVDVEEDHKAVTELVEPMDEESTLMTPTSPSCN